MPRRAPRLIILIGSLGAFQAENIPCIGLSHVQAQVRFQDQPARKEPSPYPRDGSLEAVRRWIDAEFLCIAREGWPPSDSFCRVLNVFPTSRILSSDEWAGLARRVAQEIGSEQQSERRAALGLVNLLVQLIDDAPQLKAVYPPELFDSVASRLTDEEPEIRRFAPNALAGIAGVFGRFEDAVPLILKATRDPDTQTRRWAVSAINSIGYCDFPLGDCFGMHAPAVVEAMLTFTEDPEPILVIEALVTVGLTGKAGRPAVPRLAELLRSENRLHRAGASMALEHLGSLSIEALPTLIENLTNGDERDRTRAAIVIGAIGPSAERAVPFLITALDDPAEGVPWSAARALMEIGPAAREALPRLEAGLDEDPEAFGGYAKPAIDAINGLPLPPGMLRPRRPE